MRIGQHNFRMPVATAHLGRVSLRAVAPRHLSTTVLEYLSPFACKSDARGRTKWYGVYTEEQYQAQRQSEERARWAAGVRTLTNNQSHVAWDGSLLDPAALLAGVTLVIISPRKPVSVGTVARACGSFECEDLRIVMPRQESYITRHAKSASKGAQYILFRAAHYDSVAEATADCDVRIAFTRWAQASSPHVFKVDINGLTSHPAVQRVITQPLQLRDAADVAGVTAAAASRPLSAPWSEAAAAAAAVVEARLWAAAGGPVAASDSASGNCTGDGGNEDDEAAQNQQQSQQQHQATTTAEGFLGRARVPLEPQLQQEGRQRSHGRVLGGGESDSEAASTCDLNHSDDGDDGSVSGNSVSSSSGTSSDGRAAVAVADRPTGRPPRVALVFGREELGMSDDEVDSCEVCCSIPIGRLQESLSLSHAVSIALCALYQARLQHLSAAAAEAKAAAAPPGKAMQLQALKLQPHLAPTSTDDPAGALAAAAVAEGAHARVLSYTVDASSGAIRAAAVAAAV